MAERRYERTDDGRTWTEVTEARVREVLAGSYVVVDLAMDEIHAGQEVRTTFAVYREKKSPQPKEE